jgi:uncharacterized damage-inducible protein DinB
VRTRTRRRPLDVERELLEEFERSGEVTAYLVSVLPARIWRSDPPGGRGRSIAATVAHIQSVRRTFAKMGGAAPVSALDRLSSTPAQAHKALRQSTDVLMMLFRHALEERRTRVRGMPRRVVNMMLCLVQHDAHHRGQISMLARSMGP